MAEEIFIKILNHSATEPEKSNFYKSLEEDIMLKEQYLDYKNIHASSNINAVLPEKFQRESFDKFWSKVSPAKSSWLNQWHKYAAIFIISLSVGYLTHYFITSKSAPLTTIYSSEKGSVSTIQLEDGSVIWLSSESKITINKNPGGEMTALLNGEAYFDMVPDPKRDFIVDLGVFKVKDIGTAFNIRAYAKEKSISAQLVEGEIAFYKSDADPILTLKPGEYMQFERQTNNITVINKDPSIATAWKDGKFVFIDKTLAEISTELEKWYNVQIIIENKRLAETKYTSVIRRTTTLNQVLKMLSLTGQINYKINERKEAHDIIYIY